MLRLSVLGLFSLFLFACATQQPLRDDAHIIAGRTVETISSNISLSLRTAEKNMAIRGFMAYRRPDQLRLILLSPFGSTVMEALLAGDRLTLVYRTDGVAYQGTVKDLPPAAGQREFALLHWILDSAPPVNAPASGVIELPSHLSGPERITLQNGLVITKRLASGEQVHYSNHTVLSGVRLPLELHMDSSDGERIRLTLEDPEINTTLAEQTFSISLHGLYLLPLSQLKARRFM